MSDKSNTSNKSTDYKIIKPWKSNNQPGNLTINLPKAYINEHNLLECERLLVRSIPEGILIQPLREINK